MTLKIDRRAKRPSSARCYKILLRKDERWVTAFRERPVPPGTGYSAQGLPSYSRDRMTNVEVLKGGAVHAFRSRAAAERVAGLLTHVWQDPWERLPATTWIYRVFECKGVGDPVAWNAEEVAYKKIQWTQDPYQGEL